MEGKYNQVKTVFIKWIPVMFLFMWLGLVQEVKALTVGQLSFDRITCVYFGYDHNNCAAGPQAGYFGYKVKNISASILFDVQIKFNSISGSSPGFDLISPSDSVIMLGRLDPGDSATAYFYIKYPCVDLATYSIDFTASDANPGTVATTAGGQTKKYISASAGGMIINTIPYSANVYGTVAVDTVTYEIGGANAGDIIDFQPATSLTFKSDKLRLLKTLVVYSDMPTLIKVGDVDKLSYISPTKLTGSNFKVKFLYYYFNTLWNETTDPKPNAAMFSGVTLKFIGNYGTTSSISSNPTMFPIFISKTVNRYAVPAGDTVTYTIRLQNLAPAIVSVDRVVDILPDGYHFLNLTSISEITVDNSRDVPMHWDSGRLTFLGGLVTSSNVNPTYAVPANGALHLIYDAKVHYLPSGVDTNTVFGQIGDRFTDTAHALTCVGCTVLPVNLLSLQTKAQLPLAYVLWSASDEKDISQYQIFRNYDNGEKLMIASVSPEYGQNGINNYRVTDPSPIDAQTPTTRIYSLVAVENNGASYEFKTKLDYQCNPCENQIKVLNNPISETLEITLASNFASADLEVTDYTGKVVFSTQLSQVKKGQVYSFPSSHLANGVYQISVKSGNFIEVQRFMKI